MLRKMKTTNTRLKRSARNRWRALLVSIGLVSLLGLAMATSSMGFHYQVISVNQGYGYEVTQNGKVFIHQDCIPSMKGNQPFKTKEGAEEVARLVVKKLKKGQSPTVSPHELDVRVRH